MKYLCLSALLIGSDLIIKWKQGDIPGQTLRAFVDNLEHGFAATLSWLMVRTWKGAVLTDKLVLIESFICFALSSLVDIDHFIVARSWKIEVTIGNFSRRPEVLINYLFFEHFAGCSISRPSSCLLPLHIAHTDHICVPSNRWSLFALLVAAHTCIYLFNSHTYPSPSRWAATWLVVLSVRLHPANTLSYLHVNIAHMANAVLLSDGLEWAIGDKEDETVQVFAAGGRRNLIVINILY